MDGKNFSKLCKDCGIVDKKFTLTDADLTFSKVRPFMCKGFPPEHSQGLKGICMSSIIELCMPWLGCR